MPFGARAVASARNCVRFVVAGSPSQCTQRMPANGPAPSGTTRNALTGSRPGIGVKRMSWMATVPWSRTPVSSTFRSALAS